MQNYETLVLNPAVMKAKEAFQGQGIVLNPKEVSLSFRGELDMLLFEEEVRGLTYTNRGYVNAYFDRSLLGDDDVTLQVLREVWEVRDNRPNKCLATACCWANIREGQVINYRIAIGNREGLTTFYLDPDGNVLMIEDEDEEEMHTGEGYEPFPSFQKTLQSFVSEPLNPDSPSSVLTPILRGREESQPNFPPQSSTTSAPQQTQPQT